MPKHYKEMMDELINKMDEDAPANSVAGGGVDMAPNAKHPLTKSHNKYQKKNKDAENILRNLIMKRMGQSVKENTDNNNVVLRSVNKVLNNLEDKIDEKFGEKMEEVKIVPEKDSFHDKFIKDLLHNTPNEDQFDEQAPNTADAMKRYKAGKAGFTDKAHLKAKGLIARSDGTKRKSDKYK
tara:strand:+ start:112 stop:654 length:543 start_codon:yes stop_codon:yes gene_type:complete